MFRFSWTRLLLAIGVMATVTPMASAADQPAISLPMMYPAAMGLPMACVGCETSMPVATGGNCSNGNCGFGALFAPNRNRRRVLNGNEPLCASRGYPRSDWHYIRQFCGPTLNPGSCYGHYQTKWRRWEDACPTGNANCSPGFPGSTAPISMPQQYNPGPVPGSTPNINTPQTTPPSNSNPIPAPGILPKTPKMPDNIEPKIPDVDILPKQVRGDMPEQLQDRSRYGSVSQPLLVPPVVNLPPLPELPESNR